MTWQPVVVDAASGERPDQADQVYDTLADQLRELVAIGHPNRRLTAVRRTNVGFVRVNGAQMWVISGPGLSGFP